MSTAQTGRRFTRLTAVSYDTYLQLRDAPGNDRLKMAYHDGVLEIMSPAHIHDDASRKLFLLVIAYCDAFDVDCQPAGGTTFRKGEFGGAKKGSGKEPDESFYFRDVAHEIVGKDDLDLTVDPPPSLWLEVDNRGSSRSKLPVYAALGVPEVWRYRPRTRKLRFVHLADGRYEPIDASLALPGLTPETVLELLVATETQVVSSWDRWLRTVWFPAHRQELIDRGAGR